MHHQLLIRSDFPNQTRGSVNRMFLILNTAGPTVMVHVSGIFYWSFDGLHELCWMPDCWYNLTVTLQHLKHTVYVNNNPKCKVKEWPQEAPKIEKQDTDGLPHNDDAITSTLDAELITDSRIDQTVLLVKNLHQTKQCHYKITITDICTSYYPGPPATLHVFPVPLFAMWHEGWVII